MKHTFAILLPVLLCLTLKNSFSQVPVAIPYQAVARDISGGTINNQLVSLRFSIHDANAGGTVVYKETNSATTNALGLFSVNIGQGIPVIGTLTTVNWGTNAKFLQVEIDVTGGLTYVDMGTQQLLSVPYALFSGKSADIPSGNSPGDVLEWNGSAWVITPKCNLFTYYFRDADVDGYGDRYRPVFGCAPLPGFVADSTDCDDNNSSINPGIFWYQDFDGDGFGNNFSNLLSCLQPSGYVSNNLDCNDINASIFPGAGDLPDDAFIDNNCDGVDGTVAYSIFVSPLGNDLYPGTKTQPKLTINAGIAAAVSGGKIAVLIASGVYAESITMSNGISLYGGYNTSWVRSGSNIVTVTGLNQSDRVSAIEGISIISPTTVDRIRFITSAATGVAIDGSGKSNYSVLLSGCVGTIFKNCLIQAGSGSAGIAGPNGPAGANGNSGSNGLIGACETNVVATGGSGGTSSCGRTGGNGGAGGYRQNNGTAGTSGVGQINFGNGGNWGDPGQAGANGISGNSGTAGSNGSGGTGGFVISGWLGSNGVAGSTGNGGNGGGGGGGGGGQYCTFCVSGTGCGGGGGGAGGCGGIGGTGGMAGGGSFGMMLINSTSIQVINSSVISGNGGSGGNGGDGGTGGSGGNGGLGGIICTSEVGKGGNGGAGGTGGSGGHGGGGSGGPSYGVYRAGTSSITLTATPITIGFGGNGGTSSGNLGNSGASATMF